MCTDKTKHTRYGEQCDAAYVARGAAYVASACMANEPSWLWMCSGCSRLPLRVFFFSNVDIVENTFASAHVWTNAV